MTYPDPNPSKPSELTEDYKKVQKAIMDRQGQDNRWTEKDDHDDDDKGTTKKPKYV